MHGLFREFHMMGMRLRNNALLQNILLFNCLQHLPMDVLNCCLVLLTFCCNRLSLLNLCCIVRFFNVTLICCEKTGILLTKFVTCLCYCLLEAVFEFSDASLQCRLIGRIMCMRICRSFTNDDGASCGVEGTLLSMIK